MLKKIDHIAINVHQTKNIVKLFCENLGLSISFEELMPSIKEKIVFIPIGDTDIELCAPTSEDAPIMQDLKKHGSNYIDHIAFEVENLAATLKELKAKGIKSKLPEPISGARNTLIMFLDEATTDGFTIELVEKLD